MKTRVLIGYLSFLFTSFAFARTVAYLPQGFCSQKIQYTHYTTCYEPEFRQSSWVKYELTLEQITGPQRRTNDYRMDPAINDPVFRTDYRGSGYDRGHLLPAAAMKLDHQSMSETFYMTNMSPQVSSFNRRIWAWIERDVRKLVKSYGDAHVVTAPVLVQGLPTIFSGVAIPELYYKIIYLPGENKVKAFLIENKRHDNVEVDDFVVTIDEIESLTGFDFFSELPDDIEDSLESQIFDL